MKKSFVAAVALLGVVTLGGCTTSTGIANVGGGMVAESRTLVLFGGLIHVPKKIKVYACPVAGGCQTMK